MIDELYVRVRLQELEHGWARHRIASLFDKDHPRGRGRHLRCLLGTRLVALGAWFEAMGTAIAASEASGEGA